jgi:beta-lactamase regulating signal transducer with metallopeptidase domain/predicted  nucleic acid-binding Zn-ribbon protein
VTDNLGPMVEILGSAILHSVWQITVIGLLAWACLSLLRRARSSSRYAVACVALLLTLIVPIIHIATALSIGNAGAAPTIVASLDQGSNHENSLLSVDFRARTAALVPWLVAAWALGAAAMSLRVALGLAWIRRLRRRAQPLTDAFWTSALARTVRELRLERHVELLVADVIGGPISAGMFRPFVLVPTAMLSRVPIDVIEALIAHELAHIKRHDYFINLLQSLVEALLFYHPVVWWLSRRIRHEREHIADQLAAQSSIAPRRLAHALAALDSFTYAQRKLVQAADGGQLMSRIEQLMKPTSLPAGGRIAFATAALGALFIAVLAQAEGVRISPPVTTTPLAELRALDAKRDDTYALVDGKQRDGFSMSGSLEDLDAIRAAQRSLDGKFVWFRQGQSAYVIQDPTVVAKVEQEFAVSRKHDAEMAALTSEMEIHSQKVDSLAARIEALVGDIGRIDTRRESEAIEARAERQVELDEEYREIDERIAEASESERGAMMARMHAIEEQRVTLDHELRQLEAELTKKASLPDGTQAEVATLEKQIQEASKPMEPLGKKIEAVATEQTKKFAVADRTIRKLLADAQSRGLAQPAPARM